MIYTDIQKLAEDCDVLRSHYRTIIVTSGGFDPIHIGHVRCLRESSAVVQQHDPGAQTFFIAIVNGDGFLTRKKGKPFMKLEERMEIVHAIKGVDAVVGWDDGSQTVVGALEIIKPDYFTKGGDRDSAQNVPEADICAKIGCSVVYGVGGGKIQSSSDLLKNR